MELRIDRQALVPVVQQIVDALSGWIRLSGIEPGTRLPSIRQLARDNLLSQSCVVEAYERMVAQGVLVSRHGTSFFVAMPSSAPEFSASPRNSLPLGHGGMPEHWRESDDLGYAICQVSRTDMQGLFSYSSDYGLPALRQQILRRLRSFNIAADETQVISTTGATHGLDLIIRALLKPGDCVVVENPGYPNLFEQLRLHGVRLLEVPRTPRGPDIEALEALMRCHSPRALFINSLCHNPTGTSLSLEVAQQLLALAEQYGAMIVEDDVYADFQGRSAVRLAALDRSGCVIYVGSFSKTLSSSLRVGFVMAGEEIAARLATVKRITSLGTSQFCESVLAQLLANGAYRKLIQRQRLRLRHDMRATLQVLEDREWEVFGQPTAGLYIWARPKKRDRQQICASALLHGVSLSCSSTFNATGQTSDWLRINVAYADDARALAFFQECSLSDRPQAS